MSFHKLPPKTIREHKGKSFAGVVTCFVCHDGKGKIFLTQRSANARDEQHKWDYGGGGLKFGVTVENNVRREVKEEFDADTKDLQFLGYRNVFRTMDGTDTHWLALDFAVLVDPAQAKINEPDQTEDCGWFTFDDLPKELHSQVEGALKIYRPQLEKIWQQAKKWYSTDNMMYLGLFTLVILPLFLFISGSTLHKAHPKSAAYDFVAILLYGCASLTIVTGFALIALAVRA